MTASRLHNAALFLTLARTGLVKGLREKGLLPRPHQLSDVEVISYPKSGRTWLRVILDNLGIHLIYHHDEAESIYKPDREFDPLRLDGERFSRKRVVFLLRDPRDVIVSSYFQATRRERAFEGSLEEFISHPKMGIESLLRFHHTWLEYGKAHNSFKSISYEEMTEDVTGTVIGVLDHIGIGGISQNRITRTARLFEFDRMQSSERSGILKVFYGGKLKPTDRQDEETLKTRKGKVGGYLDYLAPEQISYCDSLMRKFGSRYIDR
jgi:hypothetical protein